jgi:hypothetical protein
MTLFKGGIPAYLSKLQDDDTTSALAGSEGGIRRISIKGGVFREMIGNKEVRTSDDRAMNVIIVKSAPSTYRQYYAGQYVEGQNASAHCWSSNGQTPDATVPQDQKQATKCMDCPQNVKGSGQGETRACRYHQRIAVLLEGETEKREVYQVICPATSVFGDGEKNKLPLQAYGRHLKAHNMPVTGVLTEMRFDTASPTPKLVFKAVRPITEEEFEDVDAVRNSPEAAECVKMTAPSPKKDALFEPAAPALAAPKAAPKPVAKPAAKPEPEPVEAEEVEVPAPVKASAKKPAVVEPSELADLVEGWDD